MRYKLAALMLTLPLALLPLHEDNRKTGPICDRFSLCFICGPGATCLIPGLPLPDLPGLG